MAAAMLTTWNTPMATQWCDASAVCCATVVFGHIYSHRIFPVAFVIWHHSECDKCEMAEATKDKWHQCATVRRDCVCVCASASWSFRAKQKFKDMRQHLSAGCWAPFLYNDVSPVMNQNILQPTIYISVRYPQWCADSCSIQHQSEDCRRRGQRKAMKNEQTRTRDNIYYNIFKYLK